MIDDFVGRDLHQLELIVEAQRQGRLAAGAMKGVGTHVPITDGIGPAQGKVRMPAPGTGLIAGLRIIDEELPAHPAAPADKCAVAEIWHIDGIEIAPITDQGEVEHRLAEFVLHVNILDGISLVDDIYQMQKLGDAPEDFADAEPQLPVVAHNLHIGLAQVEVAAAAVGVVKARKRLDGQARIVVPFHVELGLQG